MVEEFLFYTFISALLIFSIHNVIQFLSHSMTSPKTKNLTPDYSKMYELMKECNKGKQLAFSPTTQYITCEKDEYYNLEQDPTTQNHMKNELKQYMQSLQYK